MKVFVFPGAFYKGERDSYRHGSEVAAAKARAVELVERLRKRKLKVNEACYRVGVPVSTYYRWRGLLRKGGLRALERHHASTRRSRLAPQQRLIAEEVERLRQEYPWGKEKITVLLRRRGYQVSESTVGRVISKLVARGAIRPCGVPSSRVRLRASHKRAHARRKRYGEKPTRPGELVQIDTLHSYADGIQRRHFTAICPTSRYPMAEVFDHGTSRLARVFLDRLIAAAPFEIRSIQVDNGSEFKGEFEARCAELGIELVTIKPHTPKMNAVVERMNRTFRDEFYTHYAPGDTLKILRIHLQSYLERYNQQRPHKALQNRTPMEYLALRNPNSQTT